MNPRSLRGKHTAVWLTMLATYASVSVASRLTIFCNETSLYADGFSVSMSAQLVEAARVDLSNIDLVEVTGMMIEPMLYQISSLHTRVPKSGGREVVWVGQQLEDNFGFATFTQAPMSDDIIGSFSNGEHSYSLATLADGTLRVKRTAWSDFPSSDTPMEDIDSVVGTLAQRVQPNAIPPLTAGSIYKPDISGLVRSHNITTRKLSETERNLQQEPITIDVLVLVTRKAMCEFGGEPSDCEVSPSNQAPMEGIIPLLQAQTNGALSSVEVAARIRIVSVVFLSDSDFDGQPLGSTLLTLLADRAVQEWREEAGADLIALIGDPHPFVCGVAHVRGYVSVTSYDCFDDYTFTHEIGHNLGGNHEREYTPEEQLHAYGHGYRYQTSFHTIMAYGCFPLVCPLVPYFSSKDHKLPDGRPLGDDSHDNARVMSENIGRVAALMDQAVPMDERDFENDVIADTVPSVVLTCPASDACPGENLYHVSYNSTSCQENCFAEQSLWQVLALMIGYRCGPCP